MMAVDHATELADGLRAVLTMLDDKYHGLASFDAPPSNECGCHCCDLTDDIDEVREQVRAILQSEAAIDARRALDHWDWADHR